MKARITAARETVELDRTGALKRIAVYEFTLDELGPFTFQVPVTEDTPERLREAIKKKEVLLTSIQEK